MTEYAEEILRSFGKFTPNMVSEIRRATLLEVVGLAREKARIVFPVESSPLLTFAQELERMAETS